MSEIEREKWVELLPGHAPCDDEGFVTSFSADDEEGIQEFYSKYGFVVVRNVLEDEQVDRTVDEMWESAEVDSEAIQRLPSWADLTINPLLEVLGVKRAVPKKLERGVSASWAEEREGGFWPYGTAKGLVGNSVARGEQSWTNRTSAPLHQAFAAVLGEEQLLVAIDRYGMMRPTLVVGEDGELVAKDQWRTQENWFHWDMNPWYWSGAEKRKERDPAHEESRIEVLVGRWSHPRSAEMLLMTENNDKTEFGKYDKVQGLVALTDSGAADGGFTCVPGFHSAISAYCEAHKLYSDAHYVSAKGDLIPSLAQKITMRKGSVVVWSSCLPHCNYPNSGSTNFRMCQYIKMFPYSVLDKEHGLEEARREAVKKLLPESWVPTDLGRRLLGLEPW